MLVGIPPCVLLMSRRKKILRWTGLPKFMLLSLSKLLMVLTRYNLSGFTAILTPSFLTHFVLFL